MIYTLGWIFFTFCHIIFLCYIILVYVKQWSKSMVIMADLAEFYNKNAINFLN